MAGIATIIGGWGIGQVLSKLREKSIEATNTNFNFRRTCEELDIKLPLKDDYKILYLETLVKLGDTNEENTIWLSLFDNEKMFISFKESDQKDEKEILYREMESQLHTNRHHLKLKGFNNIPESVLQSFYKIFNDLKRTVRSPQQSEEFRVLSSVDDSLKELNRVKEKADIDQSNNSHIIQQFKSASFILAEAPNTFNNLPNSHIDRSETTDLINWIEKDLDEKMEPIALLVGDAGTGKTTILKDLLVKLQVSKIPVLGIKADRFYAESRKELEEKLNLEYRLIRSFKNILHEEEKLVVIIDQIDALSQSLSARREYLDTINQLVRDASELFGIRIIISIRTFDLAYDDDFRFYKNHKELKVKNLTKSQVEEVLKKVEFPLSQLSETLLDLIKIPLHLNVFCKVYDDSRSYQNIKTLNDLYGELWQEKIVTIIDGSKTNSRQCKKLLFKLAKHMNDGQWITLSSARYKDDFTNELNYLQSVGLISLNRGEIQFFHQTFYDYCFAKQFVEKKKPLTELILEKNQSLFVRSAVKMILDFQRSYDPQSYIENYRQIFTSDDYRFHIKLLLINLLGFIEKPNKEERIFVSEILLKKAETCYVFIESALSSEWFNFLYESSNIFVDIFNIREENKLFEQVRTEQRMDFPNFWYQFFRKHNVNHRSQILTILDQQPEANIKYNLASNYLFILEVWDDQIAFNLFEQCKLKMLFDEFSIYKILEDICFYEFEFTTKEYLEILEEKIKVSLEKKKRVKDSELESILKPFQEIPEFSDKDKNLFEKMCEANSESFFGFGVSLCTKLIVSKKNDYYNKLYPNYACVVDSVFADFCFDDLEDNCHNQKKLFKSTAIAFKKLAKEANVSFNKYLDENIDTEYISILKLIIYGLCENPKYYEDKIILLLKNIDRKNGFTIDRNFLLFIRELIKRSFNRLSKGNQEFMVKFICNFDQNYKIKITRKTNPVHKFWDYNEFEQEKYLFISYLDEDIRNRHPILKRTFQELERKYSKPPREDRGKIVGCQVGPPIGLSNCLKFTITDWKRSFHKYTTDDYHESINGIGGLEEHAKQFSTIVSKSPEKFIDFIEILIEEDEVPHEYMIYGVHGLMNGKCEINIYQRLFEKVTLLSVTPFNFTSIVKLTEYFIESKQMPKSVMSFLVKAATETRELDNNRNGEIYTSHALHIGRSSAIYKLTCLSFCSCYKSEIFDALEFIAKEKNFELLEVLVSRLSELIDLDPERTIIIFLLATEKFSRKTALYSMNCLKRLAHYDFSSIERVLHEGMKHESILSNIAEVIGLGWITSKSGSDQLLEIIINKGDKARSMMVRIAVNNMNNKDVGIANRSIELFERFLDCKDVSVIDEYSNNFRIMEKERFNQILPHLKLYSISDVTEKSPYGLLKYLSKCATRYPQECIDVVTNFTSWDLKERFVGGNSPVNVVVSAINSLDGITIKKREDMDYIEKGVKLFDEMLKDSRIRNSATKALEVID